MQIAHSRIRAARWAAALTIGGLILAACFNREVPTATPSIVVPSLVVEVPSSVAATLTPPVPTPVTIGDFLVYTLSGIVYDADAGLKQHVPRANISWHFVSPDLWAFNGQATADDIGIYRVPIRVRANDDILITVSAPGYLPTAVRVQAKKVASNGARLDFGLVKVNSRLPTVPGDAAPIELIGFVYDAYRGQSYPIAGASVQITTISIVHPQIKYDLITDSTGAFNATLTLHTTDQVRFSAAANGYLTTTLTRTAKDVISNTQMLIALQPTQ
jgi:hypothetical protein